MEIKDKSQVSLSRNNLDEVSFIRPILVVLLILYHSMCIHLEIGSWTLPYGVDKLPIYAIIGKLSYSFMLETFVFISGYVWAYQDEIKGHRASFAHLLKKKFMRLLLPAFIFGFLYIILIEKEPITLYHILEGPGHLWFLPMLFCCFIIGWLIFKTEIPIQLSCFILFFISLFSFIKLPLNISEVLYYMPFFLLGYMIYGYRLKLLSLVTPRRIIFIWLIFFVSFFGLVYLRGLIIHRAQSFYFIEVSKVICKLGYSLLGALSFYLTSLYYTSKHHLKGWYIKLGSLCMGVYVFQQFILKFIYYQTQMPIYINNYLLPIFAFIITLNVSLLLAYLLRMTKIGKLII